MIEKTGSLVYDYSDLRDEATDDQHDYHACYIESHYKGCVACGKETNELCVLCKKAGCDKCLYNLRLRDLAGADNDDLEFGRVCLICYQAHEPHAPYSWGWFGYRYISWSAPAGADIEKGFSSPAGDSHSWVSDPSPSEAVRLHFKSNAQITSLDVFALRSLMERGVKLTRAISIIHSTNNGRRREACQQPLNNWNNVSPI